MSGVEQHRDEWCRPGAQRQHSGASGGYRSSSRDTRLRATCSADRGWEAVFGDTSMILSFAAVRARWFVSACFSLFLFAPCTLCVGHLGACLNSYARLHSHLWLQTIQQWRVRCKQADAAATGANPGENRASRSMW